MNLYHNEYIEGGGEIFWAQNVAAGNVGRNKLKKVVCVFKLVLKYLYLKMQNKKLQFFTFNFHHPDWAIFV